MRKYTKEPIWNILLSKTEFKENFQKLLSKEEKKKLDTLKENILFSTKDIIFEEKEHRYFYKGVECISTSNVVDMFVPFTDFDKVAVDYAFKNGLTAKIWKQRWNNKAKLATTQGSFVHLFAEDLTHLVNEEPLILKQFSEVNNYIYPLSPKCVASYKYFIDCLNAKEYPFLAEVKTIWKEYYITGTFDQLIYSTINKYFILRDYKTNAVMTKDFKKPMKVPFNNLNEESLSHYIIQQNIYARNLKKLGIEVKKIELVWLKDNETYELIDIPIYSEDFLERAIKSLFIIE